MARLYLDTDPNLLAWAVERSQREESDFRNRFGENFDAWLSGEKQLTYRQGQEFAKFARLPFHYLFLDAIPQETLPIQDFRMLPENERAKNTLHPDLLDTLWEVEYKQAWLSEYFQEIGAEKLAFVGSITRTATPESLAEAIRKTLQLQPDFARQFKDAREAFQALRQAAENLRITVLKNGTVNNNPHRRLQVKMFRGFAIADAYAPFVFVNARDAHTAQLFTLAHELGHIFLGESGISNPQDTPQSTFEVERLCNAAAAELLLPKQLLSEAKQPPEKILKQRVNELAREWNLSRIVILRRLYETGHINKLAYQKLAAQLKQQEKERQKQPSQSGGHYGNTMHSRLGTLLPQVVYSAVNNGHLLYRDAYRLLGMKESGFHNFFSSASYG